jgi:hypothetical protein
MGFNKRIISFKTIQKYVDSDTPLTLLFKADALLFEDEISSKVLDWLVSGCTQEEIKLKIKQYKNENN